MREIKFRAWDKREKKMTDGFTIQEIISFGKYDTEDVIFLQFTGIKDLNGKDIYEDDIIKPKGWAPNTILVVWWENTGFCLRRVNDDELRFNLHDITETGNQSREYEVIGNIYENPELLRKKKI